MDLTSYSTSQGWPKGYLFDIWNTSNLARDTHMVNVIIELVQSEEIVFIKMGASHAPRIERTLVNALDSNSIEIIADEK